MTTTLFQVLAIVTAIIWINLMGFKIWFFIRINRNIKNTSKVNKTDLSAYLVQRVERRS